MSQKNAKKCIVFSRVSTEQQETDEQTERVHKLAEHYGYSRDRHIEVEYKESGIRLKEEERLGLNRMKELIEDDKSIDCVFAFEISRIARTKKVLFSIEEWLVERHIQLIIDTPRIELLNEDFTINDSAETVFSIFAQLAESEMRVKKERFSNGKRRSVREGKFIGGKVLFGFRVEKDKKLVPDETLRPIIIRMFEEYAKGSSAILLSMKLAEYGIKKNPSTINKALQNPLYKQITGDELFDRCQERLRLNRKSWFKKSKTYHFGHLIFTCSNCKRHYICSTTSYLCIGRTQYYSRIGGLCSNSVSIPIDRGDCILFEAASKLYIKYISQEWPKRREQIEKEIKDAEERISAEQKTMELEEKKHDRYVEMYAEGHITKEGFETRLDRLEKQQKDRERIISQLQAKKLSLEENLNDYLEDISFAGLSSLSELSTLSLREQYELVHEHISSALVYNENGYKTVKIFPRYFPDEPIIYRMKGMGRSFRLYEDPNGNCENMIDFTHTPAYCKSYRQ